MMSSNLFVNILKLFSKHFNAVNLKTRRTLTSSALELQVKYTVMVLKFFNSRTRLVNSEKLILKNQMTSSTHPQIAKMSGQ